jgi:hypothetical protein
VAKNFYKIINLSVLFQVLIHRKSIFELFQHEHCYSVAELDPEKVSQLIAEKYRTEEAYQIIAPVQRENLSSMISSLISNEESLYNIQQDFPRIECFLPLKDVRNWINFLAEKLDLPQTHTQMVKSTRLHALSGLTNRLEMIEITKLSRFVLKVISTITNPNALFECLKLIQCFVKKNSADKVMCAAIL